ncbi:MAG TPA: exodeoxyribonuclease VII large subunit [bacterium]|nr:exodeoxyribonuclease VII large subunit [bacterium]
MNGESRTIHSVSEVLQATRMLLEGKFSNILVQGELTDFKHHSSGHMYFSLKDDKGVLRCAFFKGQNYGLAFKLENGMKVVAGGTLSLYQAFGQFQMIVQSVEPQGVGSLQLAFEQLKKKLGEEGLFDPARKRALPKYPKRIAIVTSSQGAAIQDFLKILATRVGIEGFDIFDVHVQGKEAPAEIIAAIREISEREEHDVLVLTRGGGSQEDLAVFNDEGVVRALAASQVPTISAIGHEVDFSLCDFVADLRAPTPTAAAAMLAPGRDEVAAEIEGYAHRLRDAWMDQLEGKRRDLKELAGILQERRPDHLMAEARQDLDRLAEDLEEGLLQNLQDQKLKLQRFSDFLARVTPMSQVQPYREKLKGLAAQLQAYHPHGPLKRGYAIVSEGSTGKILRDARQVAQGDRLHVQLGTGSLESEVLRIEDPSDPQ